MKVGERVRIIPSDALGIVVGADNDLGVWSVSPVLSSARDTGNEPKACLPEDILELEEASTPSERMKVSEQFQCISFSSYSWIGMGSCPKLLIYESSDGLCVRVGSWLGDIREELVLEQRTACLLESKFIGMGSHEWSEAFLPDYPVLDGYSWHLDVYAQDCWYGCSGSNAVPHELIGFFEFISSLGLPKLWSDEGPRISLECDDEEVRVWAN